MCSISFVKDILYPYALKKAQELLPTVNFPPTGSGELESHLAAFPAEATHSSAALLSHMAELTAKDVKAPYLKALQGFLWKEGYASGEITVDLFPDAALAIDRWSHKFQSSEFGPASGVYIYSSGSVAAQKLLFGHTRQGDLNHLLKGYFDTVNAGPKTEKTSYEKIADAIGLPGAEIRFFSDNPAEITAAEAAGWETVFTVRPGNAPAPANFKPKGLVATNFDNVSI